MLKEPVFVEPWCFIDRQNIVINIFQLFLNIMGILVGTYNPSPSTKISDFLPEIEIF